MKKILPGEKRATSPNISVNESVTSDKRCIENAFNKFFASAATRLMSVLNFSGVPNLRQLSAFTHRNRVMSRIERSYENCEIYDNSQDH